MNPPWGRIAFVGASLGVHLAIVGAVLAVSRTEAPAPLPPIQVDVVQESRGAYRRAFARTLPSIEARAASNTNRPLPSAPPSRANELAPVGEVLSVVDEPLRVVSDMRPEVRLDPLPPCGGGLGRGACLETLKPALREIELAAPSQAVLHTGAALPQIDPAPPNAVRLMQIQCTSSEQACFETHLDTQSRGPLLRDGALRLLSMRPVDRIAEAPQHEVYNSLPHPEEARRAVSKDAPPSTRPVALAAPARAVLLASPAPGPDVIEDRRPANARELPPRDRVHEIAARHFATAIEPPVVAAIDPRVAIDRAELTNVPPPRRKPVRAERLTPADKTPERPGRKPPHLVAAVKPEPEPVPKEEREHVRLATAAEVAQVLKALKPEPATEPSEALTVPAAAQRGDKAAATSPDGANDPSDAETILAAAPGRDDAPQAADSAPAFRGAALGNALPRYPYAARVRGIEGEVLLRVVVLPSGRAADVTLRSTSGSALLDGAARDAVRDWRFRPAKRGGQTVVGWVDVPVRFRLTD